MTDNPYNSNAIYFQGDVKNGYNFYGMEVQYLEKKGFTFSNGQANYPIQQQKWQIPMAWPPKIESP